MYLQVNGVVESILCVYNIVERLQVTLSTLELFKNIKKYIKKKTTVYVSGGTYTLSMYKMVQRTVLSLYETSFVTTKE